MKNEKKIDELFREKLQNFEQEPPAYLLGNILDGVAGARRKRRMIIWRVAGVAAALLLAFVAGWQLKTSDIRNPENQVMVSAPVQTQKSDQSVISAEPASRAIQETHASEILLANNSNTDKRIPTQNIESKESSSIAALSASEITRDVTVLNPLKSVDRKLQSTYAGEQSLQVKRNSDNSGLLIEKSIDQQIMEQNQKQMVAENKLKDKTRWAVGAQVSPEYNSSKASYSKQYASNMLATSTSTADLGGGISVEVKKGKRWSIQSGVYYSGINQSAGNRYASNGKASMDAISGSNYFNTAINVDASRNTMSMNSGAGVIELSKVPSGLVLGTSLEDKSLANSVIVSPTSFQQNFDYIEIPLYLRYTLIDTRFDVVMLGGFSSNLLVGNQIWVDDPSGKSLVGKTKDMETMNYSGTVGVGLKYGLSKHISLNVEPRLKYYLNSLNSNEAVSYKPYTFGVFTGLSYEF